MTLRPLGDWVIVELEPASEVSKGGIILVGPQPVRIAKAVAVGPGRVIKSRFRPTEVRPGDRFPFFKAVTETGKLRPVAEALPEGQEMIQESDILFVIEDGGSEVSI